MDLQYSAKRYHAGPVARARGAKPWAAALGFIVMSSQALGQAASTVTPESFQPPPQRQIGALVFSGEPGLNAPPGADQFSVSIAGVSVEGTLPGLEDETVALEQRLTRGRIAVAEIFDAATRLEEAYANAGYVLARLVVPAQTLVDGGTLRLTVVDGFVERVDASAVPAPVKGRLADVTAPLVGQRGLTLPELERRILLAGDTYGVALGSALATGSEPGGTVIILEPEFKSITGFVGFDNAQTAALGDWSVDAGVEFNGFFGLGEVIYIRGSAYPSDFFGDNGFFSDSPRLRTISVGGVVPLNPDGLSFNLEYADSRSAPEAATATASTFQRVSARLYYPFVRSRARNISGQLSFDAQADSQEITATGIETYRDETRVLRAGIDGVWLNENGSILEGGATLSFGLDALGAISAADAAAAGSQLSRNGADAQFVKLELSGRYRQNLGDDYTVSLSGRAQSSFGDPLVTGEQFGIANARELSAFGEGAITGDSGFVVRAEVSRPMQMSYEELPLTLRPYAFAAGGAVYRELPGVGEASVVRATSYGIGVEAFLVRDPKYSNASVRLELSDGSRSDGGSDGTRVSLSGSFRF